MKFENLEEMSKWTGLFFSKCVQLSKQTKKLKTEEKEKSIVRLFRGKKEEGGKKQ